MDIDEQFMQRCLDLALKGLGNVAPNPLVGCVIVHDGKIIGEGYHERFGGTHAEVNAINSVSNQELLLQSTLYVNLEPCSHFGKTPPCADLIILKKIPCIAIGSIDPNPLVGGKGVLKLKDAGIDVSLGVLQKASDFLNCRFFTFHVKHRPYIILKWAQSSDGFIAPQESKQFWLTNVQSKKLVHKWRSEEQAILVGRKTVETDNPQLTVRLWHGKNPIRITIDKNLELGSNHSIFSRDAPTIVFNQIESSVNRNTEHIKVDFEENTEEQILHTLSQKNVSSVIIEGGAETLNYFICKNLWDEARIFFTPHQLQSGKPAPQVTGTLIEESDIENDLLKIFTNPNS